ncbi:larval cuticle protein 1-like [Pieris napi]|uniref:larval cuticle protein 1-like n=1 Tax=Pieris napi TaxID=78633 RepID=UPI001FB888D3|nr:larval cuticle protein 1-like [Pieris napi]
MKLIIVALAFVAVAAAAVVPVPSEQVQILRSDFQSDPEGGYNFGFETSDGSSRAETGSLKEVLDEDNKPHQVVTVRGTFSYINADGTPVTVTYTADEFGFRAEGNSIPKAVSRR